MSRTTRRTNCDYLLDWYPACCMKRMHSDNDKGLFNAPASYRDHLNRRRKLQDRVLVKLSVRNGTEDNLPMDRDRPKEANWLWM